jgi:PrtD family type I secretion system ABC transporter
MTRQANDAIDDALMECRTALPPLVLFSLFVNLLILTSPLYMMQIFDRVLASGRTETLIFLTLIAGAATLFMGGLHMARGQVLNRIARWLGRALTPELIARSSRAALRGHVSGAQSLRDLEVIRGYVSGTGILAVFDMPWTPLFVAVIWLLHPWLGAVALTCAVGILVIALLNEYISRHPLREAHALGASCQERADAAIRNADVMQAMGMLPGFLTGWMQRHEASLALQAKAGDRSALLLGFSRFFRVFAQIAILGMGAYLVLRAELSSGGMVAASILLGRALAPVEQAMSAWKGLISARAAYGRLKRLLSLAKGPQPSLALPDCEGRIAVEEVTWIPRGRDDRVLDTVTFEIEAGQALGIIGPSASGKSSLCRVMVGACEPTRGHARIDGADVLAWPTDALGAAIGYLPQDVELFSGSIAENIARLQQDADACDIVEAARLADVHEMILRLPNGYETQIGDRGCLLSGGQRQRIGLARALFRKPKLLILDEPNSNLDQDGETALLRAVEAAKSWQATVVIVSHTPRILGLMDRLLLLREGRVVAIGPREEILSRILPRVPPAVRKAPNSLEPAFATTLAAGVAP